MSTDEAMLMSSAVKYAEFSASDSPPDSLRKTRNSLLKGEEIATCCIAEQTRHDERLVYNLSRLAWYGDTAVYYALIHLPHYLTLDRQYRMQTSAAALDLHPYDTILYVPSHGGQNTELVPVHSRGWVSEWVSRFLMAQQHNLGHLVPLRVQQVHECYTGLTKNWPLTLFATSPVLQ